MNLIELGQSTTKEFINNLNSNFTNLPQQMYPVGSIWVGGIDSNKTKINPQDIFGGTWELIDKEFENKIITYDSSTETTLSQIFSQYIIPYSEVVSFKDRTLTIRHQGHSIIFTTEADINENYTGNAESGVKLFTLQFHTDSNLWGINFETLKGEENDNVIQKQYTFALDDKKNKIFMLALYDEKYYEEINNKTYRKIVIEALDTQPQDSIKGGVVGFTIRLDFLPKHMKDEYCDKFYWKRIS